MTDKQVHKEAPQEPSMSQEDELNQPVDGANGAS